jgi:hypothetical protein
MSYTIKYDINDECEYEYEYMEYSQYLDNLMFNKWVL